MKKSTHPAKGTRLRAPAKSHPRLVDAARFLTIGCVIALPLFVSFGAADGFRLPKLILLRMFTIALLAVAAIAAIQGDFRGRWREVARRQDMILVACILAWTTVTAIAATNIAVSLYGLAYVLSGCVLYAGSILTVGNLKPAVALQIVLAPAVVNAVLMLLLETEIYTPFRYPENLAEHHRVSALLGNPDYVGVYLIGLVLIAIAAAVVWPHSRLLTGTEAVLLASGVVVSRSFTATLVLPIGVLLLAAMLDWKRAAIAAAILALVGTILFGAYTPLQSRFDRIREALATRDYDTVLSGRVGAFVAAAEMFRQHPIMGVGPHCYHYEFLPTRLTVNSRYPRLTAHAATGVNFGEVHNDQLQILAEAGLPGYCLLVAVLVLLVRRSRTVWSPEDIEEQRRRRFVRIVALPFAVCVAVVTLAQFPLMLAAVLIPWLWIAAMIFQWSTPNAPA